MFQFDFLREKNITQIIKKIEPYSYVSFDIFDTLLKRDVLHPTDVFHFIGQQNDEDSFYKKRIEAEHTLRKGSDKEEITLDEIYREIEDKYKSYKDQELKLEKALLYKNSVIYPVYEYCRNHGKKVIITSDMYLPEEFLKEILHEQGIDFDFCFISSSYKAKKVTGNLFRIMLSKLRISPQDVIHIGDSIRGDYLGAYKAKVRSILIPKIVNRTSWVNLKENKQQTIFNTFSNNHLDTSKCLYYQFGFSVFGPVLYGFIQWLHRRVDDKKIFFFARDGYVVKKAYDVLYPGSQTDYIYLSRRALSVPLLWKHSEWREFSNYITITRFFTVRTLLERLGLDPEKYQKQIRPFQLTLDTILKEKNFLDDERLKAFYYSIYEDIIENSKNEFECLAEYFKGKNFQGDIAVMDIGWNGSMQRYLREIMDILGINANINGYYFGIRQVLKSTQVHGYLYESSRRQLEPKVSFMQGLFESFFLSREGSTRRYKLNKGIAIPELYAPEYHEADAEFQAFQALQEGAIEFCKQYAECSVNQLKKYTAEEYSSNLLRFGVKPTLKDSLLFGDFRFYDTNVFPLAKPKDLIYYIQNPRTFTHDFSCSAWKAGFIKRCFKVKAPYAFVYIFFKKLLMR